MNHHYHYHIIWESTSKHARSKMLVRSWTTIYIKSMNVSSTNQKTTVTLSLRPPPFFVHRSFQLAMMQSLQWMRCRVVRPYQRCQIWVQLVPLPNFHWHVQMIEMMRSIHLWNMFDRISNAKKETRRPWMSYGRFDFDFFQLKALLWPIHCVFFYIEFYFWKVNSECCTWCFLYIFFLSWV